MKKLLLFLSSAALTAAPLASVIACGSSTSTGTGGDNGSGVDEVEAPWGVSEIDKHFDSISLSELSTRLVSGGVTMEKIQTLTPQDVQDFNLYSPNIDPAKKTILEDVHAIVQKWAFDFNYDANVMEELLDWQNSSALSVYNSQSQGRGPWGADESYGNKTYYRKDHMTLRTVPAFTDHDWVGSTFKGTKTAAERKLLNYNSLAAVAKGENLYNPTSDVGNGFSTAMGSATSFSIYRTVATGEWKSTVDLVTGERTFTDEVVTEPTLFEGLNVALSTDGNTFTDFASRNVSDLKDHISNTAGLTQIKFSTKGSVNYGIAENGSAKDSNVEFGAKDLFYGLARSFYAAESVRADAELSGTDISSVLPKFTDDERTAYQALFPAPTTDGDGNTSDPSAEYSNSNGYLYELYGLDVVKTFEANIDGDADEFILVFKDDSLKPSSLGLIENNSAIQAFPASEFTGSTDADLNATNLKFSTYGARYSGSGAPSTDGVHSLAPFIYTNFTWTEGQTRTIKMNPVYADQTWVNADTSILEVGTYMRTSGDAGSYATARATAFLGDVTSNHEYVIDFSVPPQIADSETTSKLNEYITWSKPTGLGINNMLTWNLHGFGDTSWNDLGREMMWGYKTGAEIESSYDAMEEFFYGSGAALRQTINKAVNWYTMSQEMFPGQHIIFDPITAKSTEVETSGVSSDDAWPWYLASSNSLKKQYRGNLTDRSKQWETPSHSLTAEVLDELADSVGATAASPAHVPIFSYTFTDTTSSDETISTKSAVLSTLNALSDKVKFVDQQAYAWSDFVTAAHTTKTSATKLIGVGADYAGIGSAVEQFTTYYGAGSLFSIAMLALENNK